MEIAAGAEATRLSWRAISVLLALFLIRGFILAAVMPPFEGWDEYQHLGYIDHCAGSNEPAVYPQAMLDASFLRAVARSPRANEVPLMAYGAATYSQYWKSGSLPSVAGDAPIILYEAQQPPLYYRLMAPVYRLCGGRENLRLTVSMLRLINVVFGAIALGLVLWWIRGNVPRSIALVMGCWVAFHPLLLLNVMRVANDALAYLLGTAVVVILLSKRRISFWPQTVLLAILLPMAVLAKSTNLTLLPVVAAALLIGVWRREIRLLQAVGAMVLILAFGTVMTWSYFSFNLHHFGILTPMQESYVNHQAHRHLIDILTAMPFKFWQRTTLSMWVTEGLWTGGWSFLRMPPFPRDCYTVILFLCAVLLVMRILTRRGRALLPIDLSRLVMMLLLLASIECGLMYHAAESFSAWSGLITTNPWYAALAIPWWLIVLCAGASTVPIRWARLVLLGAMPILCLGTEVYGLLSKMIPFYAATSLGKEALSRLATLHPMGMGICAVVGDAVIGAALLIVLIRIAARPQTH
jgi:hypothetical protein